MKRWPWYIAALSLIAVLNLLPFHGTDVAQLKPVEVLWVYGAEDGVVIETDTLDRGSGSTVESALDHLMQTTSGHIFLETADFLLLDRQTLTLLPQLSEWLRPACGVCIAEGEMDMEQVAAFLNAHPPGCTLRDCSKGAVPTEVLKMEEGRMELVS